MMHMHCRYGPGHQFGCYKQVLRDDSSEAAPHHGVGVIGPNALNHPEGVAVSDSRAADQAVERLRLDGLEGSEFPLVDPQLVLVAQVLLFTLLFLAFGFHTLLDLALGEIGRRGIRACWSLLGLNGTKHAD